MVSSPGTTSRSSAGTSSIRGWSSAHGHGHRAVTLGAMVFSLPRRRPWKVARETITIDHLANGRFVLPVGLGGTWDGGYSRVSTEDPSRRVRAEKLDECLEILELAWSGETVSYHGRHYWMGTCTSTLGRSSDPASRSGRSRWPHRDRCTRGALGRGHRLRHSVKARTTERCPPAAVAGSRPGLRSIARIGPFDIVTEGITSGTDRAADRALLEPLAEAGATWFIESRWESDQSVETVRQRIRRGPPRL